MWRPEDFVYIEDLSDRTLVVGRVVRYFADSDTYLISYERDGYTSMCSYAAEELSRWNGTKPNRILTCVCGADSVGAPGHSGWCEKYGI